MLSASKVEANIPAADLERARDFYERTLGLTPVQANDMFLRYTTENGTAFNVYRTEHAGKAGHTIAQWHVDDIETEVHDLKARGLTFEVYPDMPGVDWKDDIASMPGIGRAAWFKDSEGNTMCVDQEEGGS
ncbi:MAG: Glyoxalase/bleomycin resistance protein/dioxygenase [Frankiales bacterium]|nr:Glyoxalase/bleomycin resistance protein/dioxygenase [Frankiales bacterium]